MVQSDFLCFGCRLHFTLVLLLVVIRCHEVKMDCSDVAASSLSHLPSIYKCKYEPSSHDVLCSAAISVPTFSEPRISEYSSKEMVFQFDIITRVIDKSLPRCLGLQLQRTGLRHYSQQLSEFSVYFNSSIPVGIVEADEEVWKNGGVCNVSIPQDIFEVFGADYWEPGFSSSLPLLRPDSRWLRGLYRSDSIPKKDIKDLKLFQNTSIEWIEIHDIPDRIYIVKDMPLLKSILIFRTGALTFHGDSFTNTPQLARIKIESTELVLIPSSIQQLTNLKTLGISDAKIAHWNFHLQTQNITFIPNLESLSLSNNRIYSLSGKIPPLPDIKKLSVTQCGLTVIKDEDLVGFPALEQLDLSENLISLLEPLAFSHQRNLQVLNLSKNKLTSWPQLYSNSLKLLDLSSNFIKYFKNLGENGTRIEYLNISRNEIVSWNDGNIFSWTSDYFTYVVNNTQVSNNSSLSYEPIDFNATTVGVWVKKIDLSNNRVIGFTEVMLQSLKEIKELDLGGNYFHCEDCGMIPFQEWLNSTSTKVTNFGTSNPLLCSSPPANEGSILVTVQFDDTQCVKKFLSVWLFIGIHVLAMSLLISIVVGLIYYFRSPLTYMLHLYKIRRKARNFPETVYNKFAFDAFICYSCHDRQFVLSKLARTLERDSANYELCLHERDFPLGTHIVSNIVGSIQHSRKTIIVLSQHFIRSKWCNWEMEMAHHKMFQDDEHFLIFVKVEDLPRNELSLHLQFLLNTRTYLEWPSSGGKDEEIAFQRLKDALGPSIFQKTQERAPKLTEILDDY